MYYTKNLSSSTLVTVKEISACLLLASNGFRYILKRHFQNAWIESRATHKVEASINISDLYYLAGLLAAGLLELDADEIKAIEGILQCLHDDDNDKELKALIPVLCSCTVEDTPSVARR